MNSRTLMYWMKKFVNLILCQPPGLDISLFKLSVKRKRTRTRKRKKVQEKVQEKEQKNKEAQRKY